MRTDHVRITSINCLRNPKNPNYIAHETPIKLNESESNELFEYTINTQTTLNTQSVTSPLLSNSPSFNNNTNSVRTPLQVLNNRNLAKKYYQNKKQRNLNMEIDLIVIYFFLS